MAPHKYIVPSYLNVHFTKKMLALATWKAVTSRLYSVALFIDIDHVFSITITELGLE